MTHNWTKIVRTGAPTSLAPSARYEVRVPALDLTAPAIELSVGELPGVRGGTLDATTLVVPSRWERVWVGALARRVGAQVEWAEETTFVHPVSVALESTQGWDSALMPDGVGVRRASTRRGEARAVARDIRQWLSQSGLTGADAARACDDVLVLVPARPDVFAIWHRELANADLPVRSHRYEPLGVHSVARWIVALAQLADWNDTPVSRDLLRSVLEPRFWSQAAVASRLPPSGGTGAPRSLRKSLRRLLTKMRRDSFRFQEWSQHVESCAEEDERVAVEYLSNELHAAVASGPGAFARIEALLHALGFRSSVRATGNPVAVEVAEKVLRILARLRYEEARNGGFHPALAHSRTDAILDDAFRSEWIRRSSEQLHGIRLVPYDGYDGSPSKLLFATGLGEGDFPVVPRRWDVVEEQNARALGLLRDDESPEDFTNAEIERQIRLAASAFQACTGDVLLSYATEGPGTETQYPGALLSLLVGGWTEGDWFSGAPGVEVFSWADEIPREPRDALSWSDAALFGDDARFRRWLRELDPDMFSAEDVRQIQSILAHADDLSASREAFRQRHPRAGEEPIFGDFSGMLPGNAEPPDAYSASALEAYGQCGTKYFFGKLLRVDDETDLADGLEATETGTIIHNAFASAAQQEIDHARGKLWSMCIEPGDSKEEAVDRIQAVVGHHLERAVREFLAEQASMSEHLVAALVARWQGAFRRWIETHVVPRLPGQPSDEELALDADVAKARKEVADYEQALQLMRELRAAVDAGQVTSKSAAGNFGSTAGNRAIKKADLMAAFESGDFDEPTERFMAGLEGARQRAGTVEDEVRAKWARHFNRDVAHAELAFGMKRADSDAASVDDPITVYFDGESIAVRGQVDRVDWDRDRHQLAIRDFKTGRRKNVASVAREIATGRHLQLPLYAMAVEELARQGHLPHLEGAEAVEVSLEFPRDPPSQARWATELRLDEPGDFALASQPATWKQLSRAWLGTHVRNAAAGHFPLYPTACPVENTGYCDFARCCGYTAELGRRAKEPRPRQPEVEALELSEAKTRYPCSAVEMPYCRGTAVDEDTVRAMHEQASQAAADVTRDVAVAAGAGTGKTYNLVLRYLAALATGAKPSEILCITFTRRAAAEMKKRVREALLSEPDGPQRAYVEALRSDAASFRRLLLSLSSAPITTIDALAGSVFREAEAFRAQRSGAAVRPMDVVTEQDVSDQLRTFVRRMFLEGVDSDDPHLRHLVERLDPISARELLLEACKRDISDELAGLPTVEDRAQYLEQSWYRIMQPAANELLAAISEWPFDEFQRLLDSALAQTAASSRPSEEGARWMSELINLPAREALPARTSDAEHQWRFLFTVFKGGANQDRFGKTGLANAFRDARTELKTRMSQRDPERWKACDEWLKALDAVPEYAETAAHATFIAQRWAEGFRAHLVETGRVRFNDVEVLARRALDDPEIAGALSSRFPYRHVFLDEAQDTSDSQIQLVESVRRMAELATGQPCHEFVVGDVKQSIYGFRGAEVDVFTKRVEQRAQRFTVNRRSTPTLIRAFNQLFEALFNAEDEDQAPLDPRARVRFEPLTWPQTRADADGAAIELFLAAGESWQETAALAEEEPALDEEPEVDEEPDEIFRATPLQRGLAARITELVRQYPPDKHGASIAILVGSWRRAEFYRDLLDAYDIAASVQGGRGLLSSQEVDTVVQWLEAAAFPNRHISLLGALRGPGIAVSDAGLYCLRMGYGVSGLAGEAPHRVRTAALYGRFSFADAVRAWHAHDPDLDIDRAARCLRRDERNLERFRAIWDELPARLGVEAPSETIAWLLDELGLWTFWHAHVSGRQAIANLRTFLDLVRDLESNFGQDPWVILRRLGEMRDNSDPAAGGLEASSGAPVVVTTYWQAKGLEWPVVILPDVEKTRVRTSARGLGDNRICIFDDELAVVHTPEVRESKPEKPMSSSVTAVTHVLDQYRRPAQRAEIRRLLYVAMTRAQEKLVISATVDVPTTTDLEKPETTTLAAAKDWATTLRVCLDLQLDADSQTFTVGDRAPWTELIEHGAVQIVAGESYGADVRQSRGTRTITPMPEPTDAIRWASVPSTPLSLLRPSDMLAATVPAPDPDLSTPLPAAQVVRTTAFATDADEGTAFHALMERHGYGDRSPAELIDEVLAELLFDDQSRELRAQAIVQLAENALTAAIVPELRAAAVRGELYHELPLRFVQDGCHYVYGIIDLVWRDGAGRYHLLDYKTGFRYPTVDEPQNDQLRHHYAQTSLYAEGLALCGLDVATFGVWYVGAPALLRWSCRTAGCQPA